MPVTRSSRKQRNKQEEHDESKISSVVVKDGADARQESSRRSASRELRQKRRSNLKSRNMGVGISISTEATSKKITFDDETLLSEQQDKVEEDTHKDVNDTHKDASSGDNDSDKADNDDDDDDVIEEVKTSVARVKAIEQLAKERETVKVQQLQTRTKKRKKTVQQDEEQEDFDDEFFAQVDVEMEEQRKQKKMKQSAPVGRHTAFLSTEEEIDSRPIQTDHNIELVVLGDVRVGKNQVNSALPQTLEDKAGIEPSETSHLFARGRLTTGKEQAKRKGTKKKDGPGWNRSKKMNVLAFGRSKVKRRKGRRAAAANFVVKS